MNISATFSVEYFLNEKFEHMLIAGSVIFEMFGRFLPNNAVKDYREVYLFAKSRLSFFQIIDSFSFRVAFCRQVSLNVLKKMHSRQNLCSKFLTNAKLSVTADKIISGKIRKKF